ncbi:MAG TPA: hypothetical protein VJT72_11160 [Pseudonocardiaceae bacterium]|nr:hypothetical protein [Pseudonocardiaceae bacterium]
MNPATGSSPPPSTGKVRDDAGIEGLVSHTLRKTVASFLDDAALLWLFVDSIGYLRLSRV